MKVLVTGTSGFIGIHLCPHLLSKGRELRILPLPDEDVPPFMNEDVKIFRGDLTKPKSPQMIFGDIE